MRLRNKPGTNIRTVLHLFGINPNEGCGCEALATKMDEAGSEKVLDEIEQYTDDMVNSIKEWRKENNSVIPTPPRVVVKEFITWACAI